MKSVFTKALTLTLAASLLAACDKIDKSIEAVNATPEKMDTMAGKMDQTTDAIRLQKLLIAVQEMSKKENQALLIPFPSGLMVAGKTFAEEAKPKELAELTYLWLKTIEEVNPLKKLAANGNNGLGEDEAPYSSAELNDIRQQKMAMLYALFVVAGMTPENTVTQLINEQIVGHGRFKKTVLQFLMMRVIFIRDLALDASLLSKSISTSGEMAEAVDYLKKMDRVLRLPFAKQIALKVEDGQTHLVSYEESLANSESFNACTGMWQKALNRAKEGSNAYQRESLTGNEAADEQNYRRELQDQAGAMTVMKTYAESWLPAQQP